VSSSLDLARRRASAGVDSSLGGPAGTGADLTALAVAFGWILAVLLLDRDATAGQQALLGAATWGVLIGMLIRESVLVRVQVGVVIVFATLIEYTFAAGLGVYEYRLGGVFGVPSFVPPGHGIVYLAALLIGRLAYVRSKERWFVAGVVLIGGAWALWGVFLSPQPDALGAFWFLCLLGFLAFGRRRTLYVGAFVAVTYLEIIGTHLGTWVWQPQDPTGLVSIGNPPSGAAGGYGWFDLAAVALAPVLVVAWRRRANARRLRRDPAPMLRYPAEP
jgi:hypothetical protein